MKVYNGSIAEDEVFPNQTGYLIDGTSFTSDKYINEFGEDHLEINGYKNIDQNASVSLSRQFTKGLNQISKEDKRYWAIFLNSLLSRSPKNIELLENTVKNAYTEALETIFEGRVRSGDLFPNQFIEQIKSRSPLSEAVDKAKIHHLNHILQDKFINQIIDSPLWINTEIQKENFLITSDYPVVLVEEPVSNKIIVIQIALSPKLLQSIYFPTDASVEFHNKHIEEFISYHNLMQLQGKPNFIYSDRQLNNKTRIRFRKAMEMFLEVTNHKTPQ